MSEQNLQQVEKESISILEQSKKYVVTTQDEYTEVAGYIKNINTMKKKIKDFFEPTIERFKKAKAEADKGRKDEIDRMNVYLRPVEEALDIVKNKCKEFENEQIRIAKEEQARLEAEEKRLADEERQRLLDKAAEEEAWGDTKTAEKLLDKAEEVKEEKVKVKPEIQKVAGLGIRRVWKWKVKDEYAIPRKYWVLNEVLINKEVVTNKENCEIPGIEAYQE